MFNYIQDGGGPGKVASLHHRGLHAYIGKSWTVWEEKTTPILVDSVWVFLGSAGRYIV